MVSLHVVEGTVCCGPALLHARLYAPAYALPRAHVYLGAQATLSLRVKRLDAVSFSWRGHHGRRAV